LKFEVVVKETLNLAQVMSRTRPFQKRRAWGRLVNLGGPMLHLAVSSVLQWTLREEDGEVLLISEGIFFVSSPPDSLVNSRLQTVAG
jgi:hypothetical protein